MVEKMCLNAPLVLGIALFTVLSLGGCHKAATTHEEGPAVMPSPATAIPLQSFEEEFGPYTYRDISPGESRAAAESKLKVLGFIEQDCTTNDPTIQCKAKSEADSSAPTVTVEFRENRLTRISFDFDYSQFQHYIDAVTHATGKPTLGLHEREIGGRSVDWTDQFTEPCKHIRITDTGGTLTNEIREGIFALELHDASQHPTREINLCSKAQLTDFKS